MVKLQELAWKCWPGLAWTTPADDHIPLFITASWFPSTCSWPSPDLGCVEYHGTCGAGNLESIREMPSYLGYNSSSFFFSIPLFSGWSCRIILFTSFQMVHQPVRVEKHMFTRLSVEFILSVPCPKLNRARIESVFGWGFDPISHDSTR